MMTCDFKVISTFYRGGGDLLRQLHALAEAESKLLFHQKCLSEIDAKVGGSYSSKSCTHLKIVIYTFGLGEGISHNIGEFQGHAVGVVIRLF